MLNSSTAANRWSQALSARGCELRSCRRMTPTQDRWCHLRAVGSLRIGIHQRTRAFWNWRRRVTFLSAGHAGRVSVTVARAAWYQGRLSTNRNRSTNLRKATCSSVAHARILRWSLTCERACAYWSKHASVELGTAALADATRLRAVQTKCRALRPDRAGWSLPPRPHTRLAGPG